MRSLLIFLAALLLCAPAQAQVAGGDYDSDAQFYFDVLAANSCIATTPAFKLAVSHYIQAEKVAGNWGNQDAEYLLATSDSCTAAVNLAQPTLYKVTWTGSCAFAVLTGLNGDGTTCFGDTGVLQSALTRITQNNAHEETWINASNAGCCALGTVGSGAGFRVSGVTNRVMVLNSSQANGITDTGLGVGGLYFADRASSSVITTGSNGAAQNAGAASVSIALTAQNVIVCKSNTAFCPAGENLLFVGFGAPMNSESSHYTNVRTMLLALGVTGI